ncbi:conserved hypothetical protein [Ricinus communis]|uniref:Uncharacterized protein n=1 Tax=Ricinus communis TaxID=3988 RepID=B9RUT2_RICCO|nr:conserved hypothetical protein [Ricinus communis]
MSRKSFSIKHSIKHHLGKTNHMGIHIIDRVAHEYQTQEHFVRKRSEFSVGTSVSTVFICSTPLQMQMQMQCCILLLLILRVLPRINTKQAIEKQIYMQRKRNTEVETLMKNKFRR